MRETIRLNPNLPEAYIALSKTLRFLKRYDDAKRQLDFALQLTPDDKLVLYRLGWVYLDLQRADEATKTFQRILLPPFLKQLRIIGALFSNY